MRLPAFVRNWLRRRQERRAVRAVQVWVEREAKRIELPTRRYHEWLDSADG